MRFLLVGQRMQQFSSCRPRGSHRQGNAPLFLPRDSASSCSVLTNPAGPPNAPSPCTGASPWRQSGRVGGRGLRGDDGDDLGIVAGGGDLVGGLEIGARRLDDVDVDAGVRHAKETADVSRHLEEMGVKSGVWLHALETPPDRLYYLTPEEMKAFALVTDGTGVAEAK